MAMISIEELFKLIRDQGNWRGCEPPERILDISLGGTPRTDEKVINHDLRNQTLTYEARHRTVVIDFDEYGHLVGIEFV